MAAGHAGAGAAVRAVAPAGGPRADRAVRGGR